MVYIKVKTIDEPAITSIKVEPEVVNDKSKK